MLFKGDKRKSQRSASLAILPKVVSHIVYYWSSIGIFLKTQKKQLFKKTLIHNKEQKRQKINGGLQPVHGRWQN